MGLGARWHEIARTYADVNMAFGDIVKVTPSSKVVGDMAIFLVNHNMTMQQFEQVTPDHNLTLPGAKPRRGRPAPSLPKIDLEDTAAAVEKKIGRKPLRDEVLSYLMYP